MSAARESQRPVDLRSDTVTVPTEQMRRAMYEAEVGDDVYGEDPTVNRLEELAAEMLGHEAALFVCSGTMGNQVAVLTHCGRGDELILESDAHIFLYEVGAVAGLAGAHTRTLPGHRGMLSPEQVSVAVRGDNVHFPRTRLLCLENTHNRAGGSVLCETATRELVEVAHGHGVAVHLDGARLFNAAVKLGVAPAVLTEPVDSVQICLSKGLCCPAGSILAGSRGFIDEARRQRKSVGGGLRQAGFLAAPAIVALGTMVDRLAEDHARAARLAGWLAGLPGVDINPATVETNIVCFEVNSAPTWVSALARLGVLSNAMGPTTVRLVTHKDIDDAAISKACEALAQAARGLAI
jgi:threonine aldolase